MVDKSPIRCSWPMVRRTTVQLPLQTASIRRSIYRPWKPLQPDACKKWVWEKCFRGLYRAWTGSVMCRGTLWAWRTRLGCAQMEIV